MIVGYVSEALEPVIEIGLKGAAGLTKIAAVVDTGFRGYPKSLYSANIW